MNKRLARKVAYSLAAAYLLSEMHTIEGATGYAGADLIVIQEAMHDIIENMQARSNDAPLIPLLCPTTSSISTNKMRRQRKDDNG